MEQEFARGLRALPNRRGGGEPEPQNLEVPTHFGNSAASQPALPIVLPASLNPRLSRQHREQSWGGKVWLRRVGFHIKRKETMTQRTGDRNFSKQTARESTQVKRKSGILPWFGLCASGGVVARCLLQGNKCVPNAGLELDAFVSLFSVPWALRSNFRQDIEEKN